MAFPLSSAFISHKASIASSLNPSLTQQRTHLFQSNPTCRKSARAPFRPTFCCIFSKNPSTEVNRKHKILSNFCASTFKDGTKRFESTIAVILFFVQIASPLPFTAWNSLSLSPAEAVLYSPDTKVPRTGELALRKAIPANTNMKTIQGSLEDISYLLRIPQRKPFGTMEGNVKKALKIAVDDKGSIMASIPADLREKGSELYDSLIDGKVLLKEEI
ncbi:hypothetical protein RHMOL_Rhmol06G0283400 [Rhododendron molle]|uniref:Uncharacterized protein n=2 Tax=Rhododendron molle TaxID=49168 RepID=A0ACC0NIT5_RHOML|nr:hypothetical protein RHMOL_Rhmol06G0283400 [Rhododendron molle]KAI8552662.1 hypothetical protein RHMOL_Rhmol06G0283400 [Rhododendron molle]